MRLLQPLPSCSISYSLQMWQKLNNFNLWLLPRIPQAFKSLVHLISLLKMHNTKAISYLEDMCVYVCVCALGRCFRIVATALTLWWFGKLSDWGLSRNQLIFGWVNWIYLLGMFVERHSQRTLWPKNHVVWTSRVALVSGKWSSPLWSTRRTCGRQLVAISCVDYLA